MDKALQRQIVRQLHDEILRKSNSAETDRVKPSPLSNPSVERLNRHYEAATQEPEATSQKKMPDWVMWTIGLTFMLIWGGKEGYMWKGFNWLLELQVSQANMMAMITGLLIAIAIGVNKRQQ